MWRSVRVLRRNLMRLWRRRVALSGMECWKHPKSVVHVEKQGWDRVSARCTTSLSEMYSLTLKKARFRSSMRNGMAKGNWQHWWKYRKRENQRLWYFVVSFCSLFFAFVFSFCSGLFGATRWQGQRDYWCMLETSGIFRWIVECSLSFTLTSWLARVLPDPAGL